MTDWTPAILDASILIVDDEPANVLLLEKLLASQGYRHVSATTDPRRAIEIYRAQPPDLVLLDLSMPELDGFAVMDALNALEHDSYPPILVLTALSDQPTRVRALESGARDFLTKPIEFRETLCRIRNALELRLMHNRLHEQKLALEDTVRARSCELTDTRLEVVRRLGRAAEYRDNETGLHILRMSKISALLARHAGLSEGDCELILNASPMHDIGKIGIPDFILLKPGKLDPDEWAIMRRHTSIGAEILSGHDSELMKTARDIALGHHEKWDGSGYPHGVSGEAIPIAARIASIADVFDALTSVRPYKNAWPVSEAVREINRGAAAHFDPALVTCFNAVLPEILSIKDEHAEPDGRTHLHAVARALNG
jgi:putative two-component system response regulator